MTIPAPPEYDVFKDIISVDEIEDQILANLESWMPTYLAELCRQKGLDYSKIPEIKSWVTLQKFRHEPHNQTPAIVVVSAGTSSRPTKSGEGWWRSAFVFGVSAIISARDQESASRMSKLYASAVRAIMLQQRTNVMYTDIAWSGESYDLVDVGSPDMLNAATGTFELMLDGMVKSQGAGPKVPDTSVPAPVPVVIEDPGRITVEGKE
jgi:hypothetical protein